MLEQINTLQKEINPNEKAVIRTEQFIRGILDGVDTGGTVDLMVVFSNASVAIYDYKFITAVKSNVKGEWIIPNEPISHIKIKSFNAQISDYKGYYQMIIK